MGLRNKGPLFTHTPSLLAPAIGDHTVYTQLRVEAGPTGGYDKPYTFTATPTEVTATDDQDTVHHHDMRTVAGGKWAGPVNVTDTQILSKCTTTKVQSAQ